MRTFQFSDAKSHKFWNIEVTGNVLHGHLRQDRLRRTDPDARRSPRAAQAQADADKLINEKPRRATSRPRRRRSRRKRRRSRRRCTTTPTTSPAGAALRGLPRGTGRPARRVHADATRPRRRIRRQKDRDALKKKEKALLKKHEREWLGGLAPFVLDEERKAEQRVRDDLRTRTEPVWRRGVLSDPGRRSTEHGAGPGDRASTRPRGSCGS